MNKFKHRRSAPDSPVAGELVDALISCGSINELRNLSPLPRLAQEVVDAAVITVGTQRLTIAADIMQAGLIYPLPDPLSVMSLYWESRSRAGFAQRTMLPDARGERQMPDRAGNSIPIYITMDDFSFNVRVLRMSERIGAPLDTTMVSEATINVNEAVEDAVINGAGIQVDGKTAPGLLNHPNVATHQYKDAEAWTAAGHDGQDILDDVMAMVDSLQAAHFYGPYYLYVPTLYGSKINNDFKSFGTTSIRARLQEIEAGGANLVVRTADMLPANQTVMLQMTNDVVDMVVGQEPTVVPWWSPSGFRYYAVVMAILIHRIKSNFEEGCGIIKGYPTL